MKNKNVYGVYILACLLGIQAHAIGQIPGFCFLEHGAWSQPSMAIEHWSMFDALATSFASPVGESMHVRTDALLINSALSLQGMWGHEVPIGEREWMALYGGARRQGFSVEESASWSVLCRVEGLMTTGENTLHPFIEWSSPMLSSVDQLAANLRFGGVFTRPFRRGEMQVFWQWLEPAWTLEVRVFFRINDAIELGFSGQWQPRIWGLNCRFSLAGCTADVGLATVPLGGWRIRWVHSKKVES